MSFVVIINGPSGAGKSTVAGGVWRSNPGSVHLDLDEIKWMINDYREVPKCLALVESVAVGMAQQFLAKGLNLVIEKSFTSQEQVAPFEQLAKKNNSSFFQFNVEAPLDVLKQRVKERGVVNTKHNRMVRDEKHTQLFEIYNQNKADVPTYNSSDMSVEEIVAAIQKHIASN